jgi:hypothetical protein
MMFHVTLSLCGPNGFMRRSSEYYLEEDYGASYRVQNLTVSKMPYQHFFRTEYSCG